jgi:hypothetical protein
LDILTFTAAPRSNGVTYHGQNTSEIEVKRWPYRRNLPGGARVAHHIHIDEGFSFRLIPARHCACEQKGSMRRRTPSAAKLGAGHFKAAPSAIHHLKHTLRLSPKRFAFSAGEIVYFAVTAAE